MSQLEKVQKLIERAVHPSTPREEARTCAMKAAQLIHEHGLLAKPSASTNPPSPWEEAFNGVRSAVKDDDVEVSPYYTMVARVPGYCRGCRTAITRGDRVSYVPGQGVTHYRCRDFWRPTGSFF